MAYRYFISDRCAGCGGCHSKCPENCIDASVHPMRIDQERCTRCGICAVTCPLRAIIKENAADQI